MAKRPTIAQLEKEIEERDKVIGRLDLMADFLFERMKPQIQALIEEEVGYQVDELQISR